MWRSLCSTVRQILLNGHAKTNGKAGPESTLVLRLAAKPQFLERKQRE